MTACAPNYSGSSYSGSEARQIQRVQQGVIENIAPATIADKPSGIGLLGGALVGGVLGNLIGDGAGRVLATLGGALGGAAAGYGAEKYIGHVDANEITVRLDSGEVVAIVQQYGNQFHVGERVRVLTSSDGSARVQPF